MKIAANAAPVYSADGAKLIGRLEAGQQVITIKQGGSGIVIAYILGLIKAADELCLVEPEEWEKNAGVTGKFISFAASKVGCLYVSGAQGQSMTPALIRRLEENDADYKAALASYNKHAAAGTSLVAYDCSGLVMAFIENQEHLVSSDRTANGIYYTLCDAITRNDICGGDLVFIKSLRSSRIYHVGIYMGDGTAVHAIGRASGVVRTPLYANGWSRYGRLKCLGGSRAAATFSRVLQLLKPNIMGDDVREAQTRLLSKGFDPKGIDGQFGPNTQGAVTAFQKAQGLIADGVVTRQVWDKITA